MQRVPVIDKNGKPLMPTKASRARRMVRDGKAIGRFNKLRIYYVQQEPDHQLRVLLERGLSYLTFVWANQDGFLNCLFANQI